MEEPDLVRLGPNPVELERRGLISGGIEFGGEIRVRVRAGSGRIRIFALNGEFASGGGINGELARVRVWVGVHG